MVYNFLISGKLFSLEALLRISLAHKAPQYLTEIIALRMDRGGYFLVFCSSRRSETGYKQIHGLLLQILHLFLFH